MITKQKALLASAKSQEEEQMEVTDECNQLVHDTLIMRIRYERFGVMKTHLEKILFDNKGLSLAKADAL